MATVLWDTQIFSPQNRRCPGLELGIQISPQFLGCRTSSAQSRARVLARRGLARLVSSLADWGRPPANGEPGWGGVGVAEHLSLVSSGPQSPHSRILTSAGRDGGHGQDGSGLSRQCPVQGRGQFVLREKHGSQQQRCHGVKWIMNDRCSQYQNEDMPKIPGPICWLFHNVQH